MIYDQNLELRHWPNISGNDPYPGSGSKKFDFVFQDHLKGNSQHPMIMCEVS